VETATKLHDITKRYNVPLIINDRVDVAIASGAEGVHLGQDDMCKYLQLIEKETGPLIRCHNSNNCR
jgi:thiamine monophosphate synthase